MDLSTIRSVEVTVGAHGQSVAFDLVDGVLKVWAGRGIDHAPSTARWISLSTDAATLCIEDDGTGAPRCACGARPHARECPNHPGPG